MNISILMGSPRKNGNTAQCLAPFCDELKNLVIPIQSTGCMIRKSILVLPVGPVKRIGPPFPASVQMI